MYVSVKNMHRLDRIFSRRKSVVDTPEAVGHFGGVLGTDERVERARDEILGWLGPACGNSGVSGCQANNRRPDHRHSLLERPIVPFSCPALKAVEGGAELAFSGEPRAALQGV
jgi:hypothetical protein